jgi:hypothetical protein
LASKLVGKKNKAKKGKERITHLSTASDDHILQSVTAGTVGDFVQSGEEIDDGVHKFANAIAEPVTTVADIPAAVPDALPTSRRHEVPSPSRDPPRLPHLRPFNQFKIPKSLSMDKDKATQAGSSEQQSGTTSSTQTTHASSSEISHKNEIRDPSEAAFHPMKQRSVKKG